MRVFHFSRQIFLSLALIGGMAVTSGCETNTNEPTPTTTTLTSSGKITNVTRAGNILTFNPSDQFFSARFYEGNVAFNDVKGSGWSGRAIVDKLTDNTIVNDGVNDWRSPFNLAQVTSLTVGQTYTMHVFFTDNVNDAAQQGIIVFKR